MFYDKSKVDQRRPRRPTSCSPASRPARSRLGLRRQRRRTTTFGWWAAFGGKLMDDAGKCVADHGRRGRRLQVPPGPQGRRRQVLRQGRRPAPGGLQVRQDRRDHRRPVGSPATSRRPSATSSRSRRCPAGPAGPAQPMTGTDGWYINANSQERRPRGQAFALQMVLAGERADLRGQAGHIPADTTITDRPTRSPRSSPMRCRRASPRPQAAAAQQLLGQLRQRPQRGHRQGRRPGQGGHGRVRRDEQGQQDPLDRSTGGGRRSACAHRSTRAARTGAPGPPILCEPTLGSDHARLRAV